MVIIKHFPTCDIFRYGESVYQFDREVCGDKPSSRISLDAVLANISASNFYDLGTYLILNAKKELVISLINIW